MVFGYEGMYGSILGFTVIPAVISFFILWEAVWKAIGLWRSGRNNHIWWFVAIFLFNTLGILPIIYLFVFQKRNKKTGKQTVTKKVAKRKTVKKKIVRKKAKRKKRR
jgi:hypothetical protein